MGVEKPKLRAHPGDKKQRYLEELFKKKPQRNALSYGELGLADSQKIEERIVDDLENDDRTLSPLKDARDKGFGSGNA